MSRKARYRTYASTYRGTRTFAINGAVQPGYPKVQTLSATSYMSDSIGRPVVPASLSSVTYKEDGLRWNGEAFWKTGSDMWHFKCDEFPIVTQYGGLDTSPLPAHSGWFLDLVAGTNPSRPVLAPPTLIQDIITIPKMLFDLGKLFRRPAHTLTPKELASQYLCVQFGWKPLIEDITKLLDLQTHVLKRNRELHQLYSRRGLRRRLRFKETTLVGNFTDSTQVGFGSVSATCNFTVKVEKKVWGTINWYPTAPPPFLPYDEDMNRFSRKLVLGLTVEGMSKGLWDIIPWTWLLGWFTNFGKYLWAHSLTVPAAHSDGCLMSQSITTIVPGGTTYTSPSVTGNMQASGLVLRKAMTRYVSGSLTPGFNMPYVDMFRLSIIGALFTQRFSR